MVGVAVVVPLAWLYIENARDTGDDYGYSLEDFRTTGADFTATDPQNWLWGKVLGASTGTFGQPTFPGVVVLVLALAGAVVAWRSPHGRQLLALTAILVGAGVAIGVGTSDEGWRRWAPYRLVFEHVPGGNALRGTGRFWLVGLLGVGLLAGLVVDAAARRLAWEGPRAAALAELRRLDVRFVVVAALAGRWDDPRTPEQARPLELLGAFGSDLVYRVPDAAEAPT